jgi:hypothetical protein
MTRSAHSRPITIEGLSPALHRAVRDVYRNAMQGWHTQKDAFDEALKLILPHVRKVSDQEARRLVAQMLTQEPPSAPLRAPTAAA